MSKLITCLKMGGATNNGYTHTELLIRLTGFKAIYFSNDPNLYNNDLHNNCTEGMQEPIHQYAPLLQAIYLQKECEKLYGITKSQYELTFGSEEGNNKFKERFGEKAILPIFHYSAVDNTIEEICLNTLTEEKIVAMWVAMCTDYIKAQLRNDNNSGNQYIIYAMDIDQIKTCSMYGRLEGIPCLGIEKHAPADVNYSEALIKAINYYIKKAKLNEIKKYQKELIVKIDGGRGSIDSLSFIQAYQHCNLKGIFYNHFKDRVIAKIQSDIQDEKFKNNLSKLKILRGPLCDDRLINIFLSPIFNLFQLAKKSEAKEQVAQIELHVKNTTADLLSKLKSDLSNNESIISLKMFLKLTQGLDLPRTELELCIDTIIRDLSIQLSPELLSGCWAIITEIALCGLLRPEHSENIKSIYMHSKLHIKNRKHLFYLHNQLSGYLAFAKAINLESSHLKEDILNYIILIVSWPTKWSKLIEKNLYLLTPYLNDLVIFQHVITSIIFYSYEIKRKWQIILSLDNLIDLQEEIPAFNKEQWDIIKKAWENNCLDWVNSLNKRINKEYNVGSIFIEHMDIINRALNSNSRLPLSILIDRLIEFLSDFLTRKMVSKDTKSRFIESFLIDSFHKQLNNLCEKISNPIFTQLIKEYNEVYQHYLDRDSSTFNSENITRIEEIISPPRLPGNQVLQEPRKPLPTCNAKLAQNPTLFQSEFLKERLRIQKINQDNINQCRNKTKFPENAYIDVIESGFSEEQLINTKYTWTLHHLLENAGILKKYILSCPVNSQARIRQDILQMHPDLMAKVAIDLTVNIAVGCSY